MGERDYRLDPLEAAAALTDLSEVLGIDTDTQRAHLTTLGLTPAAVDVAMGGTEGYFNAQQDAIDEDGGDQ